MDRHILIVLFKLLDDFDFRMNFPVTWTEVELSETESSLQRRISVVNTGIAQIHPHISREELKKAKLSKHQKVLRFNKKSLFTLSAPPPLWLNPFFLLIIFTLRVFFYSSRPLSTISG